MGEHNYRASLTACGLDRCTCDHELIADLRAERDGYSTAMMNEERQKNALLREVADLRAQLEQADKVIRGWNAFHARPGEDGAAHTDAECDRWSFTDCQLAREGRALLNPPSSEPER